MLRTYSHNVVVTDGILDRLLDIVLPVGGYVVQLVEAYFDESGSDENSPVLCLAGFIIEKTACVSLDLEWAEILAQFNLPYFRMSACAHGVEPFDKLTMDERIAVEKLCIAAIKRHITYGIALTVEPKRFDAIMPNSPEIGSAYTLCAHACLTAVRGWANKTGYNGDIAYFFESGHKSQSEANALMNRLFERKNLRDEHRYVSHTFADKGKVLPLQAADLIAWQWFTDHKRRMAGKKPEPRKDCRELMAGQPYHALHYTDEMLKGIASIVLRNAYPLTFTGWQ